MKNILTYVMLDGSKEEEEKFFDGTVEEIDLEGMASKASAVSNDTIFESFFEEPHEDLIVAIKFLKKESKVELDILLRDAYYYKHIEKYMDADNVLIKLIMRLEEALDRVCWKSAAGKGCGGGCHG